MKCEDGKTNHKLGTMLTYKNIDYKHALHQALVTERFARLKRDDVEDKASSECRPTLNNCSMVHYMGQSINKILREQAQSISAEYVGNLDAVSNFSYDDLFTKIDPIVWNLVCLLTLNKTEEEFYNKHPVTLDKEKLQFPKSDSEHVKQRFYRRINAICLLQFIINKRNNYPMHIIVANCVKRLSQSTKFLNFKSVRLLYFR